MFHGAGASRPLFVIVAEIVSQKLFHGVILGVCAVFVRFAFCLRALVRGFRFKA